MNIKLLHAHGRRDGQRDILWKVLAYEAPRVGDVKGYGKVHI